MAKPAATTSASFRAPTQEQFNTLVKRYESQVKAAKELSGGAGELVAKAVEDKHLDKTAFTMFCKLNRMSPQKLAITLPHLLLYIDFGKLNEKASEQGDLANVATRAEEEGDGDDDDTKPPAGGKGGGKARPRLRAVPKADEGATT